MSSAIAENLARVRERIAAACARAHRSPDTVTVVAAAKTVSPQRISEVEACGLTVIGENRVQEARQKISLCPGRLEWHMIGHLQRNKARLAAHLFSMVHSVDSLRLLEALDLACGEEGKIMPVCLEVNVAGDGNKYGFAPDEMPAVLGSCESFLNLNVVGLMTVPPFTPDPADARPVFRDLRDLRDRWQDDTGYALNELSMGMTHDFEIAVEEGATLLRLGTAVFGQRERPAAVETPGNFRRIARQNEDIEHQQRKNGVPGTVYGAGPGGGPDTGGDGVCRGPDGRSPQGRRERSRTEAGNETGDR